MSTEVETQTTPKYTTVDMSELRESARKKSDEVMEFFEANRENLKYSKHGYRERLRQAFQEQSGMTISDSAFRQCLCLFRKTRDCPLQISTPHYKSVKQQQ